MGIIIALIVISFLFALVFLSIFIWAFKSGQFDDLKTPSMRILFEDNITQKEKQ